MLNYIFYRAYLAYEKKKESGLYSATMYCCAICVVLFMPILGLADLILGYGHKHKTEVGIVYFTLTPLLTFFYYYRRKNLKKLINKYRSSPYNKIIPSWLFFLGIPIAAVIGIGGYAWISITFRPDR